MRYVVFVQRLGAWWLHKWFGEGQRDEADLEAIRVGGMVEDTAQPRGPDNPSRPGAAIARAS